MKPGLEFGWHSQPGRARRRNQDRLVGYIPPDAARTAHKGALFLVADGMQGQPGGEVASHLAAQTTLRTYYADPSPDPLRSLQLAVEAANGWLRYWAAARPDLHGMATTLTAVAVRDRELLIAHVGDSRAYLVRGGRAWPLTRDHTWAADAASRGLLTLQEAAHHPWRHVLTRSLGGTSAAVDVKRVAYVPGDRLVLCSDGVSDQMASQEISRLTTQSPRRAARVLVRMARRRGGIDDTSAIVVALGSPAGRQPPAAPVPGPTPRWRHGAVGSSTLSTETSQWLFVTVSIAAAGLAILAGMMLLAQGG